MSNVEYGFMPTERDWEHWSTVGINVEQPLDCAIPTFREWLATHDAEVCADLAERLATAKAVIAEVDEYLDAIQKPDYKSLNFAINGIFETLHPPRDQAQEAQPVIQIPTPHNAIAQEVLICGADDWMLEDE